MKNIHMSARLYEEWLRKQLKREVVEKDLDRKHDKMNESAFVFLRATYWRWAETILEICPDLADATSVLAVGDIHIENFGTWRDAEGRLAWGVNDFDEAAEMPYALDLVRLAASALLGPIGQSTPADEICRVILQGYRRGLREPRPVVLDHDYQWLRELVIVSDKERAKFWKTVSEAKAKTVPIRYRRALADAMPEAPLPFKTARRSAGTGTLGRPRWTAVADWRGAPVVREAKALLTSAWCRQPGMRTRKIRVGEIASGCFRALDPWFQVNGSIAVRRLSPNNRKIEIEESSGSLLQSDMFRSMGFELANVHLGTEDRRAAISRDLVNRKRGWLYASAKKACDAVTRDFADWKLI